MQTFRNLVIFLSIYIFPWMIGYILAPRRSVKFISIDIPKWLKRILFIRKVKKKINIFIVINQIIVYYNLVYLLLLLLHLNNQLFDNISIFIVLNLKKIFLVFCTIMIIDGLIAEYFPKLRA